MRSRPRSSTTVTGLMALLAALLLAPLACGDGGDGGGGGSGPDDQDSGSVGPGADGSTTTTTAPDAGLDAAATIPGVLTIGAPASLAVTQKGTIQASLTVTRTRVGGVVHVVATKLPAGITAAPLDLAAGATSGAIELAASATATTAPSSVEFVATSLDDDGKSVSATAKSDIAVLGSSGNIDLTFGAAAGTVATSSRVLRVALQTDGKILALGDGWLARYLADGSSDATFGTAGKVTFTGSQSGNGLAVQADGKIVVAGRIFKTGYPIYTARYDTTGALDPTFGTAGVTETELGGNDSADGLALDANGKATVTGFSGGVNSPFKVLRYTTAGVLDGTFGTGGIWTGAGSANANALAYASDGKLVVTGATGFGTLSANVVTARLTTGGGLDATFGTSGSVTHGGGSGNAVAVQPDGKVLVAGTTDKANTGSDYDDILVLRYDAVGVLDPTFGTNGVVNDDIGGRIDVASDIKLLANGKVLVAGQGVVLVGAVYTDACVLLRYLPSGARDATFGSGGLVTVLGSKPFSAIAVQPDGRIIVGGAPGLMRFWP